MDSSPQQSKGRDDALSKLNVAIKAMNLAEKASSITSAKAVFGSVGVLLIMIRDSNSKANKLGYIELGLSCADICKALERGMNGSQSDELDKSMLEAIEQLATTVAEIQRKVVKQGKRSTISRLFHAKNDKDVIASWRLDLNRVFQVCNTELATNTHTMVADIHPNALAGQGRTPAKPEAAPVPSIPKFRFRYPHDKRHPHP